MYIHPLESGLPSLEGVLVDNSAWGSIPKMYGLWTSLTYMYRPTVVLLRRCRFNTPMTTRSVYLYITYIGLYNTHLSSFFERTVCRDLCVVKHCRVLSSTSTVAHGNRCAFRCTMSLEVYIYSYVRSCVLHLRYT